jgi:D-3-phosphoglycerate dehydrogenase
MHKKPIFLALEPTSLDIKLLKQLQDGFDYAEYSVAFDEFQRVEAIYVRFARVLDKPFLALFPNCRFVLCNATGIEHIDEKACSDLDITVISLRGETQFLETITATAELTWFLVLALVRKAVDAALAVRSGFWDRNAFIGMQLSGRTLGIAGLGRNGRKLVQYARAFDMRVIAYDPQMSFGLGVEMCDSLGSLCALSDVVCITAVSNESTRGIFNAEVLSKLRPHAFLVNSARGEIVDEEFLLSILEARKIGGYATDVVIDERRFLDNQLVRAAGHLENLLITPHIGGVTRDSWHQTERFVIDKLLYLYRQQPKNF